MRILLTILLITLSGSLLAIDNPISRINKINAIKKQAEAAFAEKNYDTAIARYRFLIDSMKVEEEPVKLNLGNAYLLAKKHQEAEAVYHELAAYSKNAATRSTAYQQLAVIAHEKEKNIDRALEFLKQALRNNPRNEEARYNYELLKKLKEQQDKENPEDQKQEDQKDQKQEEQEQEEQEGKDQKEQEQEGQEQQEQEQEGQEQQDQKQEGQEQEGEDQKGQEQEGQEGQEQEGEDQKGQKQDGKDGQEGQQQEGEEGQDGEEQKTDLGKEGEEKQEGEEGEKAGEKKEQEGEGEQKPGEKEGKGGDQKDGEEGAPTAEQLMESMNISPEKAKMILEAMRDAEVQYLQQMRRTPSKKTDRSKPDW